MSDSSEHESRFVGISRLYGKEALSAFQRSKVSIIGIGGVGSWVAECLARSGVGCINLIDLDDICLTNTNRQVHALQSTIGSSKISAMVSRLKDINPHISATEEHCFFTESTAAQIFGLNADLIIDAFDAVKQKTYLIAESRKRNIPLITCGGMGGRTDPSKIQSCDLSKTEGDRLLMLVRKRLRSQHRFPRVGKGKFRVPAVYSNEVPKFPNGDGGVCERKPEEIESGINCDTGYGSATHVTGTAAFHISSIALQLITKINAS